MKRRSLAVVLIAGLVLSLTGCLRYNSIYYIQSDGTVSGQIYTAIKEGYQTDSDPYKGTGAGDIASHFPGATITNETSAPWYAYRVSFDHAPLSAFSAVPTASWQVKITKSGNVYKVLGYDTSQIDSTTHDNIVNNGGYVKLGVGFPGALKDGGNAASSGTSSGAGWADWELTNMTDAPHAEGYDGTLFLFPGLFTIGPIFPSASPAAPATTPAPAAPDPVVTVVVTPSPAAPAAPAAPAPSPSTSASPSASPSLTVTAVAAPGTGGSGGIPPWVFITGGLLLVALVGLGSYLLAMRGRTPALAGAAGADATAADSAAADSAAADADVTDTAVMDAVEPEPKPTPKPKPKGGAPKDLPPDVV